MVAAKARKVDVLYSRKFPVGTDVEVKNRADGVIVVVKGQQPEKPIRT